MKRFFALLIILCMTIPCNAVFADGDKIFELDFSQYNAATGEGLRDMCLNSDVFLSGEKLEVGSESMYSGELKYLRFNNNGGVAVDGSVYKNLNSMTVELWAKIDSTGLAAYPRIFGLSSKTDVTGSMEVMLGDPKNGIIFYRPMGYVNNQTGSIIQKSTKDTQWLDKWTHFAVTRKINSVTNEVDYAFYINGVKNNLLSGTGTQERTPEEELLFYIGATAKGAYSIKGGVSEFRIYKKDLSQEQISQLYINSLKNYIEPDASLNVTNTSLTSENVDINCGKITVEFDKDIDKDTIDGITLVKAEDGQEIQGGVYAQCDTDTKKVNLLFGILEPDTVYRLFVSSEVKSATGIAAAEKEIEFRTGSKYIIDEDFESYEAGENPPADGNIIYQSCDVNNNASNMTVCETQQGDKYISVSSEVDKNSRVIVDLKDKVSAGSTVIVEIKIRPNSLDNTRGFGNTARKVAEINGSGASILPATITTGTLVAETTDNVLPGEMRLENEAKDENGFYNLKFIMKPDQDGNYSIEMYNMLDKSAKPFTRKVKNVNIKAIDRMTVAHIYPWSGAKNGDGAEQSAYDRTEISEIKIYTAVKPQVIYSDADGLNPDCDSFNVVLNTDIDESFSQADAELIKKSTDEKIKCSVTVKDGRILNIAPNSFLDYDSEYEILCSGLKNKEGFIIPETLGGFKTREYDITYHGIVFYDNENRMTEDLQQAVKAEIAVNNSKAEDADVTAIIAFYDEDGRIELIAEGTDTIYGKSSGFIDIILPKIRTDTAKLFVLEENNNSIRPILINPVTITELE